jgi:hypothetical protein
MVMEASSPIVNRVPAATQCRVSDPAGSGATIPIKADQTAYRAAKATPVGGRRWSSSVSTPCGKAMAGSGKRLKLSAIL